MTRKSPEPKILSCGIVPITLINGEWHFLLLRCFKYWDFPKGHREGSEDPWDAAIRELQEETGLSATQPTWGKSFRETEVYSNGKVARYYLAEVKGDINISMLPNPETGIVEHHEYRWLLYPDARALLVPRVQKILDWAFARITSA